MTPRGLAFVCGVSLATAACGVRVPYEKADAMRATAHEPLGEDRISLKWKFQTADRRTEISPQEFASPAIYADTLYVGSATGTFFALRASTGKIRWKKELGSVSTSPLVERGNLYVGTNDGHLICMDAQTGAEKWRYQSRGPVEQPPIMTGDFVVFSNEADQVVAVDAISGAFKWQYKSETPEEYTLRGHAGVVADGDLLFTGFSNGTMAALRRDTGSVAWSTSLKADADRFMDVDATPLVLGPDVYVTSSSGGVFALDKATGLVKWRVPFWDAALPSSTGNVGGITSDGKSTLYVSVADLGTYAIDLFGNVLWRVGAKDGGEPAQPQLFGDLIIYALAEDGVFIADRKTGETLEYFDPGDGISATPTVTGDGRLFVMSNRGVLYAFDLD
jgi:outer membrane protein assembly factor BamB